MSKVKALALQHCMNDEEVFAFEKGYRAALEDACLKAKDLASLAGAAFNADEILKLADEEHDK